EANLAADQRGERHAIAIQDPVAGQRGNSRTGRNESDQVKRIGTAHAEQCAGALSAPCVAEQADRFRSRKLLARHSGDEASATNLATCFQAPVTAQQLAPRRQPLRLALGQAPEHHAIAPEERAGDVLDVVFLGSTLTYQ